MKQIINSRMNANGTYSLTTNNEELKGHLGILFQIIEHKTTSKYVKLSGIKSKNGQEAFEFDFWGADTLHEALRKESLETSISRNLEEAIHFEGKENVLDYFKSIYNQEDQSLVEEILYEYAA